MLKKLFSILVICFLFSQFGNTQGISSSANNAYIPSKGFISIFSNHAFSDNGNYDIIYTNKSTKPGYVNFAKNSSWSGANENSYIDGFVRVLHDDFFTFPVGDLGFYKPISISGGKGTSVAYFFEDAVENTLISNSVYNRSNDSNLYSPSSTEYWIIKGEKPTNLILHWNSDSNLKELADDISDIKLLGWTGNDWEVIDSKVHEYAISPNASQKHFSSQKSSIETGSLESSMIVPDKYELITFGTAKKKLGLSSIVGITNNVSFKDNEIIEMTIFPNPIDNLNNVKIDYNLINVTSKAHVVIFDNSGRLILKEELQSESGIYSINYNEETDQMYNIGIVTDNGLKKLGSVLIGSK